MLDIYFKEEYGKIYELNGDGKLQIFRIENEEGSVIYNFLKREIPMSQGGKKYFDIATPYGYGGPLFLNYSDENGLKLLKERFQREFSEYCQRENIVSEFVRFHPILKNHEHLQDYMEVIYNRNTICIEIEDQDEEKIWESLTCKCRNNLKHALQHEIRVEITEELDSFYNIYIKTMEKNCAEKYYYFPKEFFQNTLRLLGDGVKIFSAFYEDKIVSSALIIHEGEYMHCHFSGNDPEYRNLAANNMLFYEAAKWGAARGKRYFHLGGGFSSNEDCLYRFKSTFTKKEPYRFYIGKKIHNEEKYKSLVEEREKIGEIKNKEFFPLYRSE